MYGSRRIAAAALALALALTACGTGAAGSGTSSAGGTAKTTGGTTAAETAAGTPSEDMGIDATTGQSGGGTAAAPTYDSTDLKTDWDTGEATAVTFSGTGAAIQGAGASMRSGVLSITAAGTFVCSGTLTDGHIEVDAKGTGTVVLVLNGVSLTSRNYAPIYVKKAEKAVITLAKGSTNTVTDGQTYTFPDAGTDEPNAAIFSKKDLTINGSGALTVKAQYNNGITSKDTLRIAGGTITVDAADDGLMGRDAVSIRAGTIRISAADDGIKATNAEEAGKGKITIEGGTITIDAGGDGIQAETDAHLSGGTLHITSGDGSANASTTASGGWRDGWGSFGTTGDETSAKGIKAGGDLTLTDGTYTIDAADDTLHANGNLTVRGGVFQLASGDDGAHADKTLTVDGGTIAITKSYEGLEGGTVVISGGTTRLKAGDDGINAAGGNDGSSVNGRPGQNAFASGDHEIRITGGTLVIDADGDGIDSNGGITMTAGTVLVSGPTGSGNGALDYDGSCTISGGLLVAAGSRGMAQAPGTSSTQNSVLVGFSYTQAAGTLFRIAAADGGEVVTFAPAKAYETVVVCSPKLQTGGSYTVYSGGTCTGSAADGLYSGGSYSGGQQAYTFTVSSAVTSVGSSSGMGGGFGGNGFGGGGRR